MTAATATAIQTQSHGDPEPPLADDGEVAALAVADERGSTTTTDDVLVGCALLAAAGAGLLLALGCAVVAAADVAAGAGADADAEPRVTVALPAMLLTADATLPLEPHAASSQVVATMRQANPATVFLTLKLPRTTEVTQLSCAAGDLRSATRAG
jgi:hypothetical protein